MDINYDVITFISRKTRVLSFAEIIKSGTIFFKTTLKDSKKVKRIMHQNAICNCIS